MPIKCSTNQTVEGIMGLMNGVTTDVARGYLATLTAADTSENSIKETISGKTLPDSHP